MLAPRPSLLWQDGRTSNSSINYNLCRISQVLGKVTIALGVFAFFCTVVILAVLLAREEPVGYSFVVRVVWLFGSW